MNPPNPAIRQGKGRRRQESTWLRYRIRMMRCLFCATDICVWQRDR